MFLQLNEADLLPMAIPRFGTHGSLRAGSSIPRRRFLLKGIIWDMDLPPKSDSKDAN